MGYSTCTYLTTDFSCRNRGEREEWTESQFPAFSGRPDVRGGSSEPHAAMLGRGGGGSPRLSRAQDGCQKDQQVRRRLLSLKLLHTQNSRVYLYAPSATLTLRDNRTYHLL